MNGPASDVFISYKAEDRKRLAPLVKALEDEGFDVWWDQHIGSGTHWREEIETHLDAAKVVIVVWSKKTLAPEGRFVRDEAGQAQEAGHYLPITVDNVRPPLGFREVQALDLSSWKGNRADPRFEVLADTIRHRLAGKEIGRKALVVGNAPVSRRGVMAGAGAATVAVAAAGGGWLLLKPSAANAKRIAVMPFDNLSGDPNQAYFAEGVAEELRGSLSRVGLQVIGRASSDAVRGMDTKTAAAKLGVANILTGSVRRSPQMVRVSAALVSGNDGIEHWEQNYDRPAGDAIKIQTDIAQNVAQALSVALGQTAKAALTLGGTADSAAQDLFLRGRLLTTNGSGEDDYRNALSLIDAAIARDPNYADAFRQKAALLDILSTYANNPANIADMLVQAEAAATRAITIAPRLGSGYATLASLEGNGFDFSSAVQNMRRAVATSPDDRIVVNRAMLFMLYFGDARKALALADRAIALDPLQAVLHADRGSALCYGLRDFPRAIIACGKAIDLLPKLSLAHAVRANSLALMNRLAEAKAEYERIAADDWQRLTGEAIVAARSRDLAGAENIVLHMRKLFGATSSYQYAEIYAQMGDANRAFAELDNGVAAKDGGLQQLKIDPFLDPIRSDPRFPALLKRLNFPTWS